jgi:hypothetical protein
MQQHLDKRGVFLRRLVFQQSDESNSRLHALNTEAILDTDRQAVQRPDGLSLPLEVIIQILGALQRLREECLCETRCLQHTSISKTFGYDFHSLKTLTSCCAIAALLQNAVVTSSEHTCPEANLTNN